MSERDNNTSNNNIANSPVQTSKTENTNNNDMNQIELGSIKIKECTTFDYLNRKRKYYDNKKNNKNEKGNNKENEKMNHNKEMNTNYFNFNEDEKINSYYEDNNNYNNNTNNGSVDLILDNTLLEIIDKYKKSSMSIQLDIEKQFLENTDINRLDLISKKEKKKLKKYNHRLSYINPYYKISSKKTEDTITEKIKDRKDKESLINVISKYRIETIGSFIPVSVTKKCNDNSLFSKLDKNHLIKTVFDFLSFNEKTILLVLFKKEKLVYKACCNSIKQQVRSLNIIVRKKFQTKNYHLFYEMQNLKSIKLIQNHNSGIFDLNNSFQETQHIPSKHSLLNSEEYSSINNLLLYDNKSILKLNVQGKELSTCICPSLSYIRAAYNNHINDSEIMSIYLSSIGIFALLKESKLYFVYCHDYYLKSVSSDFIMKEVKFRSSSKYNLKEINMNSINKFYYFPKLNNGNNLGISTAGRFVLYIIGFDYEENTNSKKKIKTNTKDYKDYNNEESNKMKYSRSKLPNYLYPVLLINQSISDIVFCSMESCFIALNDDDEIVRFDLVIRNNTLETETNFYNDINNRDSAESSCLNSNRENDKKGNDCINDNEDDKDLIDLNISDSFSKIKIDEKIDIENNKVTEILQSHEELNNIYRDIRNTNISNISTNSLSSFSVNSYNNFHIRKISVSSQINIRIKTDTEIIEPKLIHSSKLHLVLFEKSVHTVFVLKKSSLEVIYQSMININNIDKVFHIKNSDLILFMNLKGEFVVYHVKNDHQNSFKFDFSFLGIDAEIASFPLPSKNEINKKNFQELEKYFSFYIQLEKYVVYLKNKYSGNISASNVDFINCDELNDYYNDDNEEFNRNTNNNNDYDVKSDHNKNTKSKYAELELPCDYIDRLAKYCLNSTFITKFIKKNYKKIENIVNLPNQLIDLVVNDSNKAQVIEILNKQKVKTHSESKKAYKKLKNSNITCLNIRKNYDSNIIYEFQNNLMIAYVKKNPKIVFTCFFYVDFENTIRFAYKYIDVNLKTMSLISIANEDDDNDDLGKKENLIYNNSSSEINQVRLSSLNNHLIRNPLSNTISNNNISNIGSRQSINNYIHNRLSNISNMSSITTNANYSILNNLTNYVSNMTINSNNNNSNNNVTANNQSLANNQQRNINKQITEMKESADSINTTNNTKNTNNINITKDTNFTSTATILTDNTQTKQSNQESKQRLSLFNFDSLPETFRRGNIEQIQESKIDTMIDDFNSRIQNNLVLDENQQSKANYIIVLSEEDSFSRLKNNYSNRLSSSDSSNTNTKNKISNQSGKNNTNKEIDLNKLSFSDKPNNKLILSDFHHNHIASLIQIQRGNEFSCLEIN